MSGALTLQPTNNAFEYHLAVINGVDQVTGGSGASARPDIPIAAWTVSGAPSTTRELIKFDLSSIPVSSKTSNASYAFKFPKLVVVYQ